MANGKKPSPSVEAILQRASEEIIREQNTCFSVGDSESNETSSYKSAYDTNELAEFINFDMLVEDENLESCGHLTNGSEAQDLTDGKGDVMKIMLDNGWYFIFLYVS